MITSTTSKIGRSSRWRYADVMAWLSSFKPAE